MGLEADELQGFMIYYSPSYTEGTDPGKPDSDRSRRKPDSSSINTSRARTSRTGKRPPGDRGLRRDPPATLFSGTTTVAAHLHQDPATEFLTAYGETPALDVCQSKWATAESLAEDAILLTEIVDQIVLVPVQPASDRKDEEVQRRGHPGRLPGLGRNLLSPLGLSSADFLHPTALSSQRKLG